MKKQNVLALILSFIAFMGLPAGGRAVGEPRLRLAASQADLAVNEQMTIDIVVEEAGTIYGTEIRLAFDPAKVEVVAVNHGDFFSADPDKEAFVLENKFDNRRGRVDYALSLLNPAPAAEGSGLLLQLTIKAIAAGVTSVEFESGLFGTQSGQEIIPLTENVEFTVMAASSGPLLAVADPVTDLQPVAPSESESDASMILGLSLVIGALVVVVMGLIGVGLLLGIWFWLDRNKRKKRGQSGQTGLPWTEPVTGQRD
jgi:hypothetical protein